MNTGPSIIQLLLTVAVFKVVVSENQKCYVCIPSTGLSIGEVTEVFPSATSIPLCSGFHKDNKEYIWECPSSKYVGCLSQLNGTHITKTCSAYKVHDCKTANEIEYCYCTGQLCNGVHVPVEDARPAVTPGSGSREDDEDTESYLEGSGSSEESSKERKASPPIDDIGIEAPNINPVGSLESKANSVRPEPMLFVALTFLIAIRLYLND